jgi:integrase
MQWRTLSAVLTRAVEDAVLTGNPAFRMGKYVRRPDEPKAEITPLTREESERFLTTASSFRPEYYVFFLTALRAGLRLGELLALQCGRSGFCCPFIEVRRSLASGRLTTPKNHNRRRVDMSKQLGEALELRLAGAKADALKDGGTVPKWVFPNREGEPLDGDNIRRRVFEKVLTKAKLRHVRIHDLRHTFASQLIQNGEGLAYVRDQLGHASIQITVDTYGHLVPGSNRAAVDRLDSAPTIASTASADAPTS